MVRLSGEINSNMSKYLLILLLLAGCASKPPVPDAVLPPKEKVVRIDPRIFELCEPLQNLAENATFDDVLAVTINNFEIYVACSTKQSRAVKLLREFSNQKEQ
jgi:hypothetical protein